MSSLRDALRRAERERTRRQQQGPSASAGTGESSSTASSSGERPGEAAEPRSRAVLPLPPLPMEFSEELGLFRRGVESALPQPRRTLLMSSATGGEGTTTLSSLLAVSLAVREARRTCLVDLNFRSPRATQLFGMEGRPGLSDFCFGRCSLEEALVPTESENLMVMGIGNERSNPSLALSQELARGLPARLSEEFEYVLFDAASVLGTAEAGMFCQAVDGVVLVVRANRTKREVLAKAEKLVRFNGGQVLGTVLNRRRYPIPETIYKRL